MKMQCCLAFILCFAALTTCTATGRALQPGTPCPDCLNGGLCIPINDLTRGRLRSGAGARCFCPSPWVGDACETRDLGEDAEESADSSRAKAPISLGTLTRGRHWAALPPSGAADDFNKLSQAFRENDGLLLNFKVDTRTDPALKEGDAIRLAVYSALCPSSPCPSGLVLEDIRVLSLSEDADHHTEVRLSIKAPPSGGSEGDRREAVKVFKESVAAQLLEDDTSLRPDAFGGLIVHSGFHLAEAKVLAEPAAEDASGTTKNVVGNSTRGSNERWIARRPDSHKSLIESQNASCAIACITLAAAVFLFTTVGNVGFERACRWLYPSELEHSHQTTDEFEQLSPQDRDFHMFRSILEVSKFSVSPVVVKASLVYIVQLRAHELTRGFGSPPEWAEINMKILTVADVLFLVLTSLQIALKSSAQLQKSKETLIMLFQHSNWAYIVSLMAVHATQLVNTVCLVYCACSMTLEDCQLDKRVPAQAIWQGESPPSLAFELQMCLFFIVQFLVVHKLEFLVLASHLVSAQMAHARGETTNTDRELQKAMWPGRLLTKTANLAPAVTVITLAILEVPTHTKFDSDLRSVCLYIVMTVMVSYTFFVATLICLPKEQSLDVDVLDGCVLTLASCTDHIAYVGNEPRAVVFRIVRRIFVFIGNTTAAVLAVSVFYMSGDAGPAPLVPGAIMWTLLLMMQGLAIHNLILLYEIFVAPYEHLEDKAEKSDLLKSALQEVEYFKGLVPMMGLTFLCAHGRALAVTRTGELPQWVLVAMNAVVQTMLLQVVLTLLETTVAGFLYAGHQKLTHLMHIGRKDPGRKEPNLASLESSPEQPQADGFLENEFTRSGSPARIAESIRRLDAVGPGGELLSPIVLSEMEKGEGEEQPVESLDASGALAKEAVAENGPSRLRRNSSSSVGADVEAHFLAHRFLTLFSTLGQLFLLCTVYISAQLVFVAIWTLDADMPRETYSSGDWGSSIFPLMPVSAPTTTAMETMVCLMAIFCVVKLSSSFLGTLRYLYATVSFSALNATHNVSLLLDHAPLTVLLCLMVQQRAVSFHGARSLPPVYAEAHMILVVVAIVVSVVSMLAAPAFTGSFTKSESKGKLIPAVRITCLLIEAVAGVAMYWGSFVLIVSVVIMTPEDVVLPSGTSGVGWHHKGEAPQLPSITWTMLGLCLITFSASALRRVTNHIIVRHRYSAGLSSHTDEAWFQQMKRAPILRWHHGATLARRTSLESVMLGSLYIFLERTLASRHGETTPLLVEEKKVSEDTLNLLQMFFFVASVLLACKMFLIFFWGTLKEPFLGEGFREQAAPEDNGQPCLAPVSHSREFMEAPGKASSSPMESSLANGFKRLALALATCEAIVVTIIACVLFPIVHNHTTIFSTGAVFNGSIYLFALYLFTNTVWSVFVLLGLKDVGLGLKRLDGFMDVANACPMVLLLFMSARQRATEVAGQHGVVPEWMQHTVFACSIIIIVEFLVVIFAPGGRKTKQSSVRQAERQVAGQLDTRSEWEEVERKAEEETFYQRNYRVGYLSLRLLLRFSLYQCLGTVIFGLFWMTEEQCLASNSAQRF